MLLFVVVVLNPLYKLKYVRFCFDQLYDNNVAKELTKNVKNVLVLLYNWYVINNSDSRMSSKDTTHSTNLNEVDDDDEQEDPHFFFPLNLGGNWKKKIVWKVMGFKKIGAQAHSPNPRSRIKRRFISRPSKTSGLLTQAQNGSPVHPP